jgi:hypothetical protein
MPKKEEGVVEEPPYGVIRNQLRAGKVVPFLGSGASVIARPENVKWNAKRPAFLPSGLELAHCLAEEARFPSMDPRDMDDLAKVSSYYADISGRRTLRERLREVLNYDFPIGPLHEFLASVPTCLVIVVTNYDTLLERAFLSAGKPYDLVVYPADQKDFANAVLWRKHGSSQPVAIAPNELDIDLDKTTVIYKMHGTIFPAGQEWDHFVITEEDYVEFLSRMTANAAIPAIFYQYFRKRSFLFLGYSLRDWNLRVILKNLTKYFSLREGAQNKEEEVLPSWAIQANPSTLERSLWGKRNVHIFDQTLDEFIGNLQKDAKE